MQKSHTIKNKLLDVKKAISKQEMDRHRGNDQGRGMMGNGYGGSYGSGNYNSHNSGYGRQGGWSRMNNNSNWNNSWSNDSSWSSPWDNEGPNQNWGGSGGNYNQNWSNDSFGSGYQQSYSSGPQRSYSGNNRMVPYNQSEFFVNSNAM